MPSAPVTAFKDNDGDGGRLFGAVTRFRGEVGARLPTTHEGDGVESVLQGTECLFDDDGGDD